MSDSLSDLCCPICLSQFSEKDNVPHILKCGHTHCHKCLTSIIKSESGKCGECRAVINQKNVRRLPINYAVIRLVEALQKNEKNISDEYQDLETKVDEMIKNLSQSQDIYKERARDTLSKVTDLEKEKLQLQKVKESFVKTSMELKNTKSLEESFNVIKNTMDKVKKLDEQSVLINKRMNLGKQYGEFQLILENAASYVIILNDHHGSTCFVQNRRLYLKSQSRLDSLNKSMSIKYDIVKPFLMGAYMVIEYENRRSMLEIKTFPSGYLGKNFLRMCIEQPPFYVGCNFFNHSRQGLEGEYVVCGQKSKGEQKPTKENGKNSGYNYIRSGFLEANGSGKNKLSTLNIYFEDSPKTRSSLIFGKLIRGQSILKAALRNKFDVKVVETGHVFDFHAKKN